MKSGDYSTSRDDAYDRKRFSEITDKTFLQRTFSVRPALVTKNPVTRDRIAKEYHGEPYDTAKFDLVEGFWDHEHCSVCWFTIKEGFTYWENNAKRVTRLCDACYEAFTKAQR